MPDLKAFAFSVLVELIEIGMRYCNDADVGSLPFVVYRIVAPVVLLLIVTF